MSNNPTNQEKNKEPKQKAQATVKTAVAKHCLTESIAVNIICGLLFLVFGYIAIMSIFQTCVIDPANYSSEVILFQDDLFVINIFCLVIFTALLFKINKHTAFFAKVNMKFMEAGLFAFPQSSVLYGYSLYNQFLRLTVTIFTKPPLKRHKAIMHFYITVPIFITRISTADFHTTIVIRSNSALCL